MPTNRRIGSQPSDAQATVLLLNLGPATDSDGDGVADTVMASVHLFDEMAYPLSLNLPGEMRFEAYPSEKTTGEPIETWSFSGRDLAKRAYRVEVGTVYRFRLGISPEVGPVKERAMTFHCTFTPLHGKAVQAWHRDLRWTSPIGPSSGFGG
ncbi:MAG TPA: hypothetical protein ENJ00_00285 [Phycisphaerales bacterium]|nr:hypothetical protein [Phycisphaerales bacterium]